MKKIFFMLLITTLFLTTYLYAESFEIPGTYGGKAVITCEDIHKYSANEMGGECSLEYQNFSLINGWTYNGKFNISFSLIGNTSELWIDFLKGGEFTASSADTQFNVSIPESISFDLNSVTLKCITAESWSGGEPQLLINNQPLKVSCDLFPYLLNL